MVRRAGGPGPVPPKKDLGDPNAVYLHGSFDPGYIVYAADGVTPIIRTAGTYEYGFKNPAQAKWGAGFPPWAMALMEFAAVPVPYQGPRVIDPGPVPSGSGGGGPSSATLGTVDPAGVAAANKPGGQPPTPKPAGPGEADNQDFHLISNWKNAPPPGYEAVGAR